MIDIKILRENPELIKENCAKRKYDVDIDALHDLDQQYLKLVRETEDLRAERNRLSISSPVTTRRLARFSESLTRSAVRRSPRAASTTGWGRAPC